MLQKLTRMFQERVFYGFCRVEIARRDESLKNQRKEPERIKKNGS